jgi:ubiquinone/menaquinone biosynthesis C-methylase UbiE
VSLYGRLFAALYDRFMAGTERAGLAERRHEVLGDARGRVIEVGAGTGANLAHYPPAVSEIVLTEPEEPMARRLEAKLRESGPPGRVVRAPGESLPFADDEFDTAVSTLVLCTVSNPTATLAELRRVLRPGGQLLFVEHVRSDDQRLARWQDRALPLWRRFGHGCHPNRATADSIRAAGFAIEQLEQGQLPKAPPIVRPLILGRAVAP